MKKAFFYLVIQLIAVAGFCQSTTRISGTVVDSAAQFIRNASVRVLNTNLGAVTDANGAFTIENVLPANYTLQVSAVGYATITRKANVTGGTNALTLTLIRAPRVLDEVVVTAQKTEELLQEIPISITSLSSRQVQEYQLWNSNQLSAIVPNLYSADPGDRRNVSSLRGIATTSYDPAVATYIDGVNQFNLDTYIAQLFDVERIEVLRGPQGTLYGRNAMGGVINIITRQPTNKVDAFADLTLGNYGQQRYTAGVRTPIVKDKLFFGIAGLYDKRNGFYMNEFYNKRFDDQYSYTGNYYLKYLPTQKWSLTLNVKNNNNRNYGVFPLVYGVDQAINDPFKLSQNALTKMIDNNFNSSLSANYSGRGFNFSSQTSYQSNHRYYREPIDADFSPIDGVTLINNYGSDWNKVKVYTQEFRFSSPASQNSRVKWTAGTYGFHQDNPTKQATRFGADAAMVGSPDKNFSLINSTRLKSNGVAFFGQLTYQFSDRFNVTGGIRYDYEKKEQSVLGEYQHDPNPLPVFDYRSDTSATASFHAVSPKLTASYKLGNNNLLFATYSKGYRAGGLTPLSSDPSQPSLYSYDPEYSNNFEAGIKNTLLKNHLLFNITAFYSTVTDAQVPTLVLPDAVTITRNTGKLKSKGIELETSALFSGFQVDYNFGFTDAEFTNLKVAQNGSEVNLEGKKQLFTPDITSMLAAQYTLPLSTRQNLKLNIRGEWRHLGRQYFDLANTITQPSYDILNSRIELIAENFSVILWGRNLADKKYVSYGYDFGAVHLGDPRTYGVTVGVRL